MRGCPHECPGDEGLHLVVDMRMRIKAIANVNISTYMCMPSACATSALMYLEGQMCLDKCKVVQQHWF